MNNLIDFSCDYNVGAHELCLNSLIKANEGLHVTYGHDTYSQNAKKLIREYCKAPKAKIRFIAGGTLTNLVLIRSGLRIYEGVISSEWGHIAIHETGAIEATGHKILVINGGVGEMAGKITAQQIDEYFVEHRDDPSNEHIVKPGMVYLSQTTELGTVYTPHELKEISETCHKHGMYLFIDGSRLAYAQAYVDKKYNCNMLEVMAKYCDAFTIGGAKCGAMLGEALVIINDELKKGFKFSLKQSGALMAKGYIIGSQFEALFTDDLYKKVGEVSNDIALQIKDILVEKGYEFFSESFTNQQFVIIPNDDLKIIDKKFKYTTWQVLKNGTTIVRFVTNFKLTQAMVDEFKQLIQSI